MGKFKLREQAGIYASGLFISIPMGKKRAFTLLFFLFFVSGFSALVYQVAWQRLLYTLLGGNMESAAVIVSVFMLGLGTGALCGGLLSKRFPGRIIFIFALLEAGTGIYGLFSISLIGIFSSLPITGRFTTVISSISLLILPTCMMGASLPLLTTHVNARLLNPGASVAALYFYNTAGSAAASLLTVLLFFELAGLSGSVYIAASLNILVGLSAFLFLWRRT